MHIRLVRPPLCILRTRNGCAVSYSYCNTMDAPAWLTEAYIQSALVKLHQDPTLVTKNFELNPALGKGENFGGVLTRVKVQYQRLSGTEAHELSLVVKTAVDYDDFFKEKMRHYDIFNREMSIYEHVLPELEKLLRDIGEVERIFARAIHVDCERKAIVLEDLVAQGYMMADRMEGLDLAHIKLILQKLANLHASSAVLNERNKGSLESYDRGFFNRYTNSFETYFVANLINCGKLVSQWPEYAHLGRKLLALAPHYMDIGGRCFTPTPGHVNVLTHGDLWTNNVMFKYEGGRPIDVIIIDFQYSFWGSPTLDLHHFFNTSLQEPLRLNRQDMLMQFYYKHFAQTLRRLNYCAHAVPTLHQFRLQAEEKRFFAVHSACIIQPVMLNEDSEDADFHALVSPDERGTRYKAKLYQNVKVHRILKNVLPVFDSRGLLDANQAD